jgi:hypothetical protein
MHCHVNEQFLVQGNQGKYCQNVRRSFPTHEKNFFSYFLTADVHTLFFLFNSVWLTYDTGDENTECDHQLVHSYQDTPKKKENA